MTKKRFTTTLIYDDDEITIEDLAEYRNGSFWISGYLPEGKVTFITEGDDDLLIAVEADRQWDRIVRRDRFRRWTASAK